MRDFVSCLVACYCQNSQQINSQSFKYQTDKQAYHLTQKNRMTMTQYYKKQEEEKLPSEALRTCERRRVMVADNAQRWLSIIFNNDTIAK